MTTGSAKAGSGSGELVLVVDDEKNIRRMLAMVLESEGYEVVTAATAAAGLREAAERDVDMVILDVQLPDLDGISVLRSLLERRADLPVLMISGHATIDDAVSATRLGAFDFLEKPIGRERMLISVANCLRERRRQGELADLRAREGRAYRGGLLGETPIMAQLRARIAKVAPTRGRVLITGESGTGKELVARAIHEQSDRLAGPFIKVNCAAIPHDLIESTLFGHEKGAFTSAVGRRRGQFELADKGTLFLDEVGDMSLSAQAKVLRVLQTGELTRVGGERPIRVDARVLAATNRDLQRACAEGTFREDLYFRLNVVPLVSPPLRARRADVPMLARHFLKQVCQENAFPAKQLEVGVLDVLSAYDWPGNVRELRNIVERLAILSGEAITLDDVPEELYRGRTLRTLRALGAGEEHTDLRSFREAAERAFIQAKLREHGWNISRTAEAIGLERTNLHKKLKALGIERER